MQAILAVRRSERKGGWGGMERHQQMLVSLPVPVISLEMERATNFTLPFLLRRSLDISTQRNPTDTDIDMMIMMNFPTASSYSDLGRRSSSTPMRV
jgi:hypothetical protein